MNLPSDHEHRCARARRSLEGLALGDAFGECFFLPPAIAVGMIRERELPPAPWRWTDDTVMAASVVENLGRHGGIQRDDLARAFAERYAADPGRGYGGTAHRVLREIGSGRPWQRVAHEVFDGMGSMGNGGAMRAAPIGGYFHDAPDVAARQGAAASEVTHGHPEGVAGGSAVAAAASHASTGPSRPLELLEVAAEHIPDGLTRAGLRKAHRLPLSSSIETAAQTLGNGERLLAHDTVPFALWAAARHLASFEDALWHTVSALGDCDTTCAIVGGVLALHPAHRELPPTWLARREELDALRSRAAD